MKDSTALKSIKPNWQVISVGLLMREKKVLLGLRPFEDKKKGNVWEFPGGSVEWGEQAQDTMIRELKEELNIQVKESEIAGGLCDHTKDISRFIVLFYVRSWEGSITNNYHQKLAWMSLESCIKKRVPNINPQLFDQIMSLIDKGLAV